MISQRFAQFINKLWLATLEENDLGENERACCVHSNEVSERNMQMKREPVSSPLLAQC